MSPSSASPEPDPLFDLVGSQWLEGGRDPSKGIDCLGVTMLCAKLRGLAAFDVWETIAWRWAAGDRDVASMFPPGWVLVRRLRPELRQDDVVIMAEHFGETVPSGVGFVHQGHVITATKEAGVVALPADRVFRRVLQTWVAEKGPISGYDPCVHGGPHP